MAGLNWRIKNQVNHVGVRPGVEGDQLIGDWSVAATATVYTVPALKVLLLTDWALFIHSNATGSGELNVRNAAAALQIRLARANSVLNVYRTQQENALFFPIELIAGWDIRVVIAGGITVRGYIHGILIPSGYQ